MKKNTNLLLQIKCCNSGTLSIIIYITSFLFSLDVYSQIPSSVKNYSGWNFENAELSNGKLVFQPGQSRDVAFDVTIMRDKDTDGNWVMDSNIDFIFQLIRKSSSGNEIPITNRMNMTDLDFDDGATSLQKQFVVSLIGNGSASTNYVLNGDQIFLDIQDNTFSGGWYRVSTSYDVIVKTSTTGPIKNNEICCNQCILGGDTPLTLGQTPGTILSGSHTNTLWELKTHGYEWATFAGFNSLTYSPDPSFKTVTYRRWFGEELVPHCNNCHDDMVPVSGANTSGSNVIEITVSSLAPEKDFSSNTYSKTVEYQAGIIQIKGSQSVVAPSSQVSFVAARSIQILPGGDIFSNISLRIDPSILACPLKNGRIATPEEDNTSSVDESTPIINESVEDLTLYPNPASVETVIKYRVATSGSVKIIICDNSGKSIVTVLNDQKIDPGVYSINFITKNLKPGLYLCSLINNNHQIVKRLVITSDASN